MIGSNEPVQTRPRPPALGSDLLARPRLVQALRSLLQSDPVVLVSAPAGYGKTTLLASLAASGDVPVAWLSIDKEDNDPANFVRGLIGASQRVDRAYGSTIQPLFGVQPPDAGPPDPRTTIRRLIGALINDLADSVSQPCVLVLDDVHVLTDAAIFAGLDYLIERLPSPIRLVLATRYDPPVSLARRRGRGQLAELRLEELRFTSDEAATLLHNSWRVRLSADELDPTYRQLYLSLGAACANLKIAARYFGLRASDEMVAGSTPRTPSKRLRFSATGLPSVADSELFHAIPRRSSQRGGHTPRPLPVELRQSVMDDAQRAGLELHLVEDPSQLAQMGVLMYAIDRMILCDPGFTGDLSEWVRSNSTEAADGMPGSGFHMPDLESKLFPMLVRSGRIAGLAAGADRQLFAEQTTCVGVIATSHDDPSSWLAAGERFQVNALRATSFGLAANVLAG